MTNQPETTEPAVVEAPKSANATLEQIIDNGELGKQNSPKDKTSQNGNAGKEENPKGDKTEKAEPNVNGKEKPAKETKGDAPKNEKGGKYVFKSKKTETPANQPATGDTDWKEFSDYFGKPITSKKELINELTEFKNKVILPKHEIVSRMNTIFEKGGNLNDLKTAIGLNSKNYAEFIEGKGHVVSDEEVTRDFYSENYKNLTPEEINEEIVEKKDTREFKIKANEYRRILANEQSTTEQEFFKGLDLKNENNTKSKEAQKQATESFHAEVDKYVTENFKDYNGVELDETIPKEFAKMMKGNWFNELFINKNDKGELVFDFDSLRSVYMSKFTEIPAKLTEAEKNQASINGKKEVYNKITNYDPTPDKHRNNNAENLTEGEKIIDFITSRTKRN